MGIAHPWPRLRGPGSSPLGAGRASVVDLGKVGRARKLGLRWRARSGAAWGFAGDSEVVQNFEYPDPPETSPNVPVWFYRAKSFRAADVRTTATHASACGKAKPQVGEAPMGAIGQRAEDVAWWGPRVCMIWPTRWQRRPKNPAPTRLPSLRPWNKPQPQLLEDLARRLAQEPG